MDPLLKTLVFTSVYRKDYTKKKVKEFRAEKGLNTESWIVPSYLTLQNEDKIPDPFEYQGEFIPNLIEKFPNTKRYLEEPLKVEMIANSLKKRGKSIYTTDYAYRGNADYKDWSQQMREVYKDLVLPDDWDVPATTQRHSYRDPAFINPNSAYTKQKLRKYYTTLGNDEDAKKCFKAGESEYMQVIGKLGEFILENCSDYAETKECPKKRLSSINSR